MSGEREGHFETYREFKERNRGNANYIAKRAEQGTAGTTLVGPSPAERLEQIAEERGQA